MNFELASLMRVKQFCFKIFFVLSQSLNKSWRLNNGQWVRDIKVTSSFFKLFIHCIYRTYILYKEQNWRRNLWGKSWTSSPTIRFSIPNTNLHAIGGNMLTTVVHQPILFWAGFSFFLVFPFLTYLLRTPLLTLKIDMLRLSVVLG